MHIPESARMVLLQEDKFKEYHAKLSFVLKVSDRASYSERERV